MNTNWLVVLGAGIIPLIVGFVWYNPKVFGTVWMKEAGVTEEDAKKANMALVFGLTLLFGVFISVALLYSVVHQMHIFSATLGMPELKDPNSEISQILARLMELAGNNYRTFKHGALHGTITGVTLGLPIIAINSLFERKSFKYISINAGYFIITFALMGGVICAFA